MTYEQAIVGAKKAAKESGLPIAIINDPVVNNSEEEPEGPYGYCPELAVHLLHRWGTVVGIITEK